MGQKLTKDKKAACDAATSTTPPKGTTMEVDDGASKPDLQKDASKGGAHPKKSKKWDTKEVQAKEKAASTSEAMDTSNMPDLISDDDKEEQSKRIKFTTKNPPVRKPQK